MIDRTNAERQRRYRGKLKAAAASADRLKEDKNRLMEEQRWLKLQIAELKRKIAAEKKRNRDD